MTCRPENLLLRLALWFGVLGLAGCSPDGADIPPIERARIDLAAGRPADAQVILQRLVQDGADTSQFAAYLGEAALARGDIAEAKRWLVPGQFSEPTMAHGFRMQGRLAVASGNLAEAGQAYDRALALDPQSPELWVDIGRLRYLGGEQLQAIEAADHAVELGPENAAALQFRGQLARDAHGMQAGVLWFERALDLQPDNLDLRLDLVATLGDAGRAKETLAVLRDGGGAATSTPRGLFIQGVLAARGGKLSLARDLLDRSGMAREGIPAAVLLSAIIDIEEENYGIAAQTLDRLLQRQPDNRRVIDLLALALSRSGGENELVLRFAGYAASPNGSSYIRTLVGRAYEALGDRTNAAAFLDLALNVQGGLAVLPSAPNSSSRDADARAIRDDVRAAIAGGETGSALARARELAARFPGSGDVLALLGDAELAAGNSSAASAAFSRSAMVRQPWSLAPRLASSLGDDRDTFAYFRAFAAANPLNGEAAAILADAFAKQGRWREASALLDCAISLGHGRVPWVLSARSIAALQLGDSEDALAYALAANELQPMNAFAIGALIAALPDEEVDAKADLTAKIRSLPQN